MKITQKHRDFVHYILDKDDTRTIQEKTAAAGFAENYGSELRRHPEIMALMRAEIGPRAVIALIKRIDSGDTKAIDIGFKLEDMYAPERVEISGTLAERIAETRRKRTATRE